MPAPCPGPDGYSLCRHDETRARNVRIAGAARRHHFARGAHVPFICECDDEGCDALLGLTLEDYELGRSAADYLVAPGHQVDHAHVVRVRDGCWLYAGEHGS